MVHGILGTASVRSVMAEIGFIGVFIGSTLLAVGCRLVQERLSDGSVESDPEHYHELL